MFIILRYHGNKISNCQLIYPKNVINKAVYRLSAKVHLSISYKFKIIPIGFTSAKNTKNSILEADDFFQLRFI